MENSELITALESRNANPMLIQFLKDCGYSLNDIFDTLCKYPINPKDIKDWHDIVKIWRVESYLTTSMPISKNHFSFYIDRLNKIEDYLLIKEAIDNRSRNFIYNSFNHLEAINNLFWGIICTLSKYNAKTT